MTRSEFVALLPAGRGNMYRCPAHSDRSASLGVSEGREGRILLKCFAGCTPEQIVGALGLAMRDLFPQGAQTTRPVRKIRFRPLTQIEDPIETVEAALAREIHNVQGEEAALLGYVPPLISRHENEARRRVQRQLSVQLSRVPAPWYEVEPHSLDPLWKVCVRQALLEKAATAGIDLRWLASKVAHLPRAQCAVLDRAAALLHEIGVNPTERQEVA